jgi:hypothetical protein
LIHCHDLTRNHIRWHNLEVLEQKAVIPFLDVVNVVDQDLFFFWVLCEVCLERFIADKLLLKLDSLFVKDVLVVKSLQNSFYA